MRVESNGDEWIMTDDQGRRRPVRLKEVSLGFVRVGNGLEHRNVPAGPMGILLEDINSGEQIAISGGCFE